MILLRVVFTVSIAERRGFIDASREMMRASRLEPGCLHYCFSADLDSQTSFYLTEEWASEEALQAHVQTPHFASFIAYLGRSATGRTTEARSGELIPYQLQRRS